MAKKRKIYYLLLYGQMGNHLAIMAHLIAFATEYDFVIVYPYTSFLSNDLKEDNTKNKRLYYSKLTGNKFVSICLNKAIKFLFLNQTGYAFRNLIINKKFIVENSFNPAKMPQRIIITDWLFRYYVGVKRYQNLIREQLSFRETSFTHAKKKWMLLQDEFPHHTFIGVHVRRGDYAVWLGGKYFFDNATYYNWLAEMAQQIEKTVFIICSNEDLCFTNEQNLNIVYAKGVSTEDIFFMSKCRYIFGPPSTFSSWAAFLGNADLLFLENKNEVVQPDKFSKYYL